jgi:aminoglycoside 6'-N-acetyltransferase I
MRVTRAAPADLDLVDPLRRALWPDSPIEELKVRAPAMTGPAPSYAVLIAWSQDDRPAGFAEVALRSDYVNGCESSPVAFLEGIYVDAAHRRQGIARALVRAAQAWGRERGAAEFASDALLDNEASHAFHKAVGFAEMERVVYFRMTADEATA